jgi:hypothetical protein
MEYIRVKNPDISLHILPFLVGWGDVGDEIDCGMELNRLMTKHPEDTFVLTAVHDGFLKAVLIGYIRNDGDLMGWQFKKSRDMRHPQQMMHKMYVWAREKGAKKAYLGCPDKRRRRLYKRQYGYTPIDNIMMERSL